MVPYFSTWRYKWKKISHQSPSCPTVAIPFPPACYCPRTEGSGILYICQTVMLFSMPDNTICTLWLRSEFRVLILGAQVSSVNLILTLQHPSHQSGCSHCLQSTSIFLPNSGKNQPFGSEVSSSHCPSTLQTTTLNPIHCFFMAQWNHHDQTLKCSKHLYPEESLSLKKHGVHYPYSCRTKLSLVSQS